MDTNSHPDGQHRLLVVDDNPSIHTDIRKVLGQFSDSSNDIELDALEAELFADDSDAAEAAGDADGHSLSSGVAFDFSIDSAYQGEEALGLVQKAVKSGRTYSAAFIDMRMPPGWDGVETVEQLWCVDPELQVVICSAYSDYSWSEIVARLGNGDQLFILKKPFETEEIVQMAHALCQKRLLNRYMANVRKIQQEILFHDNPGILLSLDIDGVIRDANRSAVEKIGRDTAALLGRPLKELLSKSGRGSFNATLAACLLEQGKACRWEGPVAGSDGSPIWLKATLRAVQQADGSIDVLLAAEDVSEMQALQRQLQWRDQRDPLTGLLNRKEFERQLTAVCDDLYFDSMGHADLSHALCYIDLDGLQLVNETAGYLAGDEMITALARLVEEGAGDMDLVARLDGQAFGLLLHGRTQQQALAVAEEYRARIEAFSFRYNDLSYCVTASIGVLKISASEPCDEDTLKVVNTAAQIAKSNGGNRVHVVREDDGGLHKRQQEIGYIARLNEAFEKDLFCLFSQPIVPIGDNGEHAGGRHYELLIRLNDQGGDVIAPNKFLPLAERYRLSPRLDRWVIRTALTWLSDNPLELTRLGCCSINLSGGTLSDPGLLPFLIDCFADTAVPPGKICFEITEASSGGDLQAMKSSINQLKSLGCRFSLDDFGAGSSSFGALRELPVDFIKIDGSLVREMNANPVAMAMVRAINDVAQAMDKATIAEFVESVEILGKLKAIGVDYAQGYGMGKPEPIVTPQNSQEDTVRRVS